MVMDDGDLAKYIPCYGDLVTVKVKCRIYSKERTLWKEEKNTLDGKKHVVKLRAKVANAEAKQKRKSSSSNNEEGVPDKKCWKEACGKA